nr:kirrel [Novocrania anomala]
MDTCSIIRRIEVTYILSWFLIVGTAFAQQRFLVQPQNKSLIQGGMVILKCQVENLVGSLQWTKNYFGMGQDRTLSGFDRYKIIGSESDGVHDLMISDAKLEDDAPFQCQIAPTETTLGLVSQVAMVTILLPPDSPTIGNQSTVEVIAGRPQNITCRSDNGKPAASISWFTGGSEVTSNIHYTAITYPNKKQDAISSLTITPTKADEGKVYECHAINAAIFAPLKVQTSLTVLYVPEVQMTVDPPLKVKESESVSFTCTGQGNPNTLTWRWYRNSAVIAGAEGRYLQITTVEPDHDKNVITCEAKNSVGSTKKDYTLHVQFGPRFSEELKHAAADIGQSATMTCNAKGNPTPAIIWTKKGSDSILSSSSSFTIQRVAESDLGIYVCTASVMGFDKITREIHLLKKGPPLVISDLEQFAKEGDIAHIECATKSIPKPNMIAWGKEAKTLEVDKLQRYSVTEEELPTGRKSVLRIVNVHSGDYGEYNCSVQNSYGMDAKVIKLKQKDAIPMAYVMGGVSGGIGVIILVGIVLFCYNRRRNREEDMATETDSTDSAVKKNKPDIKVEFKPAGSDFTGPLESWRNDYNKDHYRYSADYDELQEGRPYTNGYGFPERGDYKDYRDYEYKEDFERRYPYDRSYDSGFEPDFHPRVSGYNRPQPAAPPELHPYPNGTNALYLQDPLPLSRLSTNV